MSDVANTYYGGVDFYIETDLTTNNTLADWTDEVESLTMPESWMKKSVRGMGNVPNRVTYGGSDATLSVTFHSLPGVLTKIKTRARDKTKNTRFYIVWESATKESGKDFEQFDCGIDSYNFGTSEGEAENTITVELQVQGAITTGTVA